MTVGFVLFSEVAYAKLRCHAIEQCYPIVPSQRQSAQMSMLPQSRHADASVCTSLCTFTHMTALVKQVSRYAAQPQPVCGIYRCALQVTLKNLTLHWLTVRHLGTSDPKLTYPMLAPQVALAVLVFSSPQAVSLDLT